MIDYQEIIENLDTNHIINLMCELGASHYKETDNYIMFHTICHNDSEDEASMKLYYYKNSHMFYCYTSCQSMNIFKFLRNYYETRNIAYDWYNDILQVVLNCSASTARDGIQSGYKSMRDNYAIKKDRKELTAYPEGLLELFIKYYPVEWLNDSISRAAMDKYNIRYSIAQNKIIIPHYDINNRLIGIRGRALNQQDIDLFGKYMPIQIENKWYSHPLSLNLYGLNKNFENIKHSGVAFIFESEKSVLQCENFSMLNCAVASCGSNVNKFQIDLLLRYCAPREIVICYDREEVQGEEKYFNKLYDTCMKYKQYANMSFIYDREGISKMKDSPSDNGEEIFMKLLERRVKVYG